MDIMFEHNINGVAYEDMDTAAKEEVLVRTQRS